MKKNLLLLHGALGSQRQFDKLSTLLRPRFNIHTLDFEGHGSFVSNCDFSMSRFSQNVIDYLDTNAIELVDVFGYSMGGYVALNLCLDFPHRVSKIVTLGTKLDWSKKSTEREVKMLNPEKVLLKVPKFAEVLANEHAPHDWRNVMDKTAQMMLDLADGLSLKDDQFSQIRHQVVMGIGALDTMVTVEEVERVSTLLANGTYHVLDDVVHPIGKVNPEILNDFISKNLV